MRHIRLLQRAVQPWVASEPENISAVSTLAGLVVAGGEGCQLDEVERGRIRADEVADGTVHAASAQQGAVGRIDDGVHRPLGNP